MSYNLFNVIAYVDINKIKLVNVLGNNMQIMYLY